MKNNIDSIRLRNFADDASHFLITEFETFYNQNREALSVPHRIMYYQLVLINEGAGIHRFDSAELEYADNTLFALAKGQVEVFEPGKNVKGFVILFTDEFLYEHTYDMEWIINMKLFNGTAGPLSVCLSFAEYNELAGLIAKMKSEFSVQTDFAKEEILRNLLKAFLLISERCKRSRMNKPVSEIEDGRGAMRFLKVLEEGYRQSRSVYYYADILGLTPKRLNQIVSKSLGKPVKRIIEERILLETKRLLTYTEKSVKEIGNSLGFDDPTNFNKFFKRYINTTPNHFRSTHKNHFTLFKVPD